jgi:hypothetical protein
VAEGRAVRHADGRGDAKVRVGRAQRGRATGQARCHETTRRRTRAGLRGAQRSAQGECGEVGPRDRRGATGPRAGR